MLAFRQNSYVYFSNTNELNSWRYMMLAFTLSSLKDATSHLFAQPSFDDFDVLSVTIVSYITFSMDVI